MLELVVYACLGMSGGRCEDKPISRVPENMTISQCMRGAQIPIALWSGLHPDWQIKSWRCRRIDAQETSL